MLYLYLRRVRFVHKWASLATNEIGFQSFRPVFKSQFGSKSNLAAVCIKVQEIFPWQHECNHMTKWIQRVSNSWGKHFSTCQYFPSFFSPSFSLLFLCVYVNFELISCQFSFTSCQSWVNIVSRLQLSCINFVNPELRFCLSNFLCPCFPVLSIFIEYHFELVSIMHQKCFNTVRNVFHYCSECATIFLMCFNIISNVKKNWGQSHLPYMKVWSSNV